MAGEPEAGVDTGPATDAQDAGAVLLPAGEAPAPAAAGEERPPVGATSAVHWAPGPVFAPGDGALGVPPPVVVSSVPEPDAEPSPVDGTAPLPVVVDVVAAPAAHSVPAAGPEEQLGTGSEMVPARAVGHAAPMTQTPPMAQSHQATHLPRLNDGSANKPLRRLASISPFDAKR